MLVISDLTLDWDGQVVQPSTMGRMMRTRRRSRPPAVGCGGQRAFARMRFEPCHVYVPKTVSQAI
ncbi:MAG: hypothetical protein CMJ44_15190 [Pimelobacter sp.]|nr:hypothetical protein [Pimelobacter sp.]